MSALEIWLRFHFQGYEMFPGQMWGGQRTEAWTRKQIPFGFMFSKILTCLPKNTPFSLRLTKKAPGLDSFVGNSLVTVVKR